MSDLPSRNLSAILAIRSAFGMIEVESGIMVPLADPYPNLAPNLPGEVGYEDDNNLVANWVNQNMETGLNLDTGLDLESLFNSIATGTFATESQFLDGEAASEQEPEQLQQPLTPHSPVSPASSDSSYHRSTTAVPRHKRPSHKRAELKRRDKIKTRLDDLKEQVPSIADKGKMSESTILSKAAEYAKHLKADCERFSTEAGNLRQEIESLSTEIHTFQERLPAAGLKPETVEEGKSTLDERCSNYVASRTKESWKFYLFNFFMKPLFESYKAEVTSDRVDTFVSSVTDWTTETLGLSHLRRQTLEKMRDISRETDILTHPESLPEKAMASIGRTAAPTAPPTSAGSCPTPQPDHSHLPATFEVTETKPVLSPKMVKRASCPSEAARPSAKSRRPKLCVAPPKTFVPLKPKLPASQQPITNISIGQPLKTVPAMTMLASAPKPVKSVAASPPKVFVSTKRKLPADQLTSTSTSVSPPKAFVPLVTVSPPKAFVPLVIKSVAGQRPAMTISIGSQKNFVPVMKSDMPSHQPVTSITQLATSIEGTSLTRAGFTSTVAPVTSSMSNHLIPSVAIISTEDRCHAYDFDITDIPDIPDLALPTPPPSSINSPFSSIGLTTTIEAYPPSVGNPILSQPTSGPQPGFLTQSSASVAFPASSTSWS